MLSKRLKELRKREGISQETLAAIVGMDRSSIGKYEGKSAVIPSAEVLNSLADHFGTTVDYLLGRTDDPTNYDDGDLIAGLSPTLLEQCNGNVRKALAMQRALDEEAEEEAARGYQSYSSAWGDSILDAYQRSDESTQRAACAVLRINHVRAPYDLGSLDTLAAHSDGLTAEETEKAAAAAIQRLREDRTKKR